MRRSDQHDLVKIALVAVAIVAVIWLLYRLILPVVQPSFVGTWDQSESPAWFLRRDKDGETPLIAAARLTFGYGPENGKGRLTGVAAGDQPSTVMLPFRWRRGSGRGRYDVLYFEPDTKQAEIPPTWRGRLSAWFGYEWSVTSNGDRLVLSYRQGDSPQALTVTFSRAQ